MGKSRKLSELRNYHPAQIRQVLLILSRTFHSIIRVYEKILHAKLVDNIANNENHYFLNCHLFGASKLGDNFYVNLALFSGDEINLSITIRSKDKAVKDILYKQLLNKKFINEDDNNEN